MILRELELKDEKAFRKLMDAWDKTPDFNMTFGLEEALSFESYLKMLNEMRDGIDLPSHFVPASTLFAFVGDEIVGKVSVRHVLNDHLFKVGGHIGYGVSPEHRQKGYASEMLNQALAYCRKLGLEKVLITCSENNLASSKVIEKNGGVFENVFDPKDGTSKKKRFWIQL